MRKKAFSKKMSTKGRGNQSWLKCREHVYVGLLTIFMLVLVNFGGKPATALTSTALAITPQAPPCCSPSVFTSTALARTYTFNDAATEAYWYSRYNLGHLVMMSGMGIQFMPPKEKVMKMMEMAGIEAGPKNPYLVKAVYSSGDPHLITKFNGDPNDLSNFRWDQGKIDKTITPQAMGYTMIKEIIWSKSFASDVEGPDPMNHFRALVLSTEAAIQAGFMMEDLKAENGLFRHGWKEGKVSDSSFTPQDQLVMLWAFSELASYTSGEYKWYAAPLDHQTALKMADELLSSLEAYVKVNPRFIYLDLPTRDIGLALAALSSYVSITERKDLRILTLERLIPLHAQNLVNRMADEGKLQTQGRFTQLATQARAVYGLILAYRVTGNQGYQDVALKAWDYMQTLWNERAGLYATSEGASRYTYTIEDVGDVVGAFNVMIHGLNRDVRRRFSIFFDNVVKKSGLQIAEGSPSGGQEDEDGVPAPPLAGGEFGQAPVFATEAVYDVDSGQWKLTNPQFATSSAMSAANQFMWIGEWMGTPSVPGHGIPQAEIASPEVKEISIAAKRYEYQPNTITVKQGDRVKLKIKSIDVTHGFGLPEFGVNVELREGKTVEVEFVADKKGTFNFRCTVFCGLGHGRMRGKLVVE
ncbi:MAG: cupredoxin domain-containing protein [bacterium]